MGFDRLKVGSFGSVRDFIDHAGEVVHSFRCWHFKHYGVIGHTPQPFLSHFPFLKVNDAVYCVYCMWMLRKNQGGPQFKTHNESFSTNKGKDKNVLQHCRETKACWVPWAAHMCLGDPGLSSDRSTLSLFKLSCHHGGLNIERFLCACSAWFCSNAQI